MQSHDRRWLLWRWKVVSKNTYITRLDVVRTPWFGVKVHWMRGPDPERDPHDHPRGFLSIVLRGGYTEMRHRRWTGDTQWFSLCIHRWFNWMPDPMRPHRITVIQPNTVTLVLEWGRRREWGFHTRNGWVHWQEYRDA